MLTNLLLHYVTTIMIIIFAAPPLVLANYIKFLSVSTTYNSAYGTFNVTLSPDKLRLDMWLDTRHQLNNASFNVLAHTRRHGTIDLKPSFNKTYSACTILTDVQKDPVLKIFYGGTFFHSSNKGFIGCPIKAVGFGKCIEIHFFFILFFFSNPTW